MRLTLRTLLAYMEDRLPPANAREIGQKIARSPFSTELMERIREVLRKRRLAASSHTKFTIDPNLIAEYLDDQLTPELVARIERELLSSDVSLAEIAACYQIIASLHETQPLDERLKQRLYDLDPSGALEVVHTLAESKRPEETPKAAISQSTPEWQPLDARVMSGRRLPAIIVTVMAFVWLLVVATDPVLFRGASEEPAAEQVAGQVPLPRQDDTAPANDDNVLLAENDGTPDQLQNAAGTGAPPDGSSPDGDNAPTPDPNVDSAASAEDAAVTAVGDQEETPSSAATGEPTTAATTTMEENAAEEPPVPDVDPVAEQWAPIRMLDRFRSTMMLDAGTGEWAIARPGGVAGPLDADALKAFNWSDTIRNRWLAIPAAYESTFSIDGAGWTARTLGPAILQVNGSAENSGFAMLSGRALVETTAVPGMADDEPRHLVIGEGERRQKITLLSADTVLGVEIIPIPPRPDLPQPPGPETPGLDILPVVSDRRVNLYVVSGSVEVTDANDDAAAELQERQSVGWTALATGEKTDVIVQDLAQPGAQPLWLFADDPLPELEALKGRVADQLAAATSLNASAVELTSDRNSQIGVLATGYLAVTRSIGPLTDVLLQAEDESVRRAAIDGLSIVCMQTRAGFDKVQRQLETHLQQDDAGIVLALLYGVSEEQARQPAFCSELVSLLSHDQVLMRELAFYRLETIAGDRYSYSADAAPGRRREAVKRWQRHLDRNNGQLIP